MRKRNRVFGLPLDDILALEKSGGHEAEATEMIGVKG